MDFYTSVSPLSPITANSFGQIFEKPIFNVIRIGWVLKLIKTYNSLAAQKAI